MYMLFVYNCRWSIASGNLANNYITTVVQAKLDLSVNIWNSLPNSVVHACSTVNVFITRLDKFWQYQWHQLAKFDFTADLTGIPETDQKKS